MTNAILNCHSILEAKKVSMVYQSAYKDMGGVKELIEL
jgi:hypothetical protein